MELSWNNRTVILENPIDLSVEIGNQNKWTRAWYQEEPEIKPVVMGDFVGSVKSGAGVNFNNVFFNPHAHGTHTETYGHITKEFHPITDVKMPLLMLAYLLPVQPLSCGKDWIVNPEQLLTLNRFLPGKIDALILQTHAKPNLCSDYSNTNPPYLDPGMISILNGLGVEHLLIDLPSVDKEKDEGKLAFHHAFWEIPNAPKKNKTITEFISVPEGTVEGFYALNLQIAPVYNDAAPSRPILYAIKE